MGVLLLAACVHLGPGTDDDAPDPRLVAADARFAARGEDPAALGQAMDAWLTLLGEQPDDPAVLARLAHGRWVSSLVEPDAAEGHLELGEAYGWRCLLASPGFGAAARARGFQVTRDAVSTLGRDDVPCLAWTVANGLDRVALRGLGAALELEPLGLLVDRLRALAPTAEGGVGFWAASRQRLLNPLASDTRRAEARALLVAAVAVAPGFRIWAADLAAAFPDARNALDVPGDDAWALENAAADERYARERERIAAWSALVR